MLSSQGQALAQTPISLTNANILKQIDVNQDPPRTWKYGKYDHPEFNRTEYSLVALETKVLIIGGYFEDEDQRAINLILLDLESQQFKIIPSVGDDAQLCCNCRISACYWKDSKIVVFGGYDYQERPNYSSAVAVVTLKDLDSENPSAHWEKMLTPTQLSRYGHQTHIYKDKMYVIGGRDEHAEIKYDVWCLDLTDFTWNEFKFTCIDDPQQDHIPEAHVTFHENKAYVFLWEKATDKGLPIMELDFGRLVYCNNHFVYYTTYEEVSDRDSFFGKLWSLPLNTPKLAPNSSASAPANVDKTRQTLKDFFFEAPYSDISFEVGSEVIKAHKWWLTKRNKFFANLFTSGMSEAQASKIKITDMKASTFKALLEFLYSDHVELNTRLALDLLQQADKYSIGELKNACEKHIIENIEPGNYVASGQIAELIGATALREAVVTFIAKNMKEVKQRKDFNDISDALLRDSLVKFIVK